MYTTRVALEMIHQNLSACPRTPIFFHNMEPSTPTTEVTWEQCQKPTPVKARIQGAIDFLKSEGITSKNEAVFRANGVSHATGYRILRSKNPRTLKNDPIRKETRHRPK